MGTPPPSEKDAPPNRGTIGAQRSDRLWLSAEQLHDHDHEPSWKAPAEKRGLSSAALIVALAIVFMIPLRVTAVICGGGHMSAPHDRAQRGSRVRWSTRRLVTLIVLLAVLALVIYLKVTGVV